MTDNIFEEYVSLAEALPSAPRVLPRLLGLLSDPNSDMAEMVDLISFDPGLTSALLRACNSAFVGLPHPVVDVSEAVNRLGVSFIYKLTAAVCGASTFRSGSRKEFASDLWQQSVTSAFAAEMLASDLGLDKGALFTSALLHDIGKMVFSEKWKESYWQLVEEVRTEPFHLVKKEQELFHINHGELGGRLLAYWKFPSPIASSVWQHHFPRAGMPFGRETACIALSEAIADTAISQFNYDALQLTPGQESALGLLEFTRDELKPYLSRTQENYQFVNAMCQIGL